MKIATYQSPIGSFLLAEKEGALVALCPENQRKNVFEPDWNAVSAQTPLLDAAKEWLDLYFAGEKPSPYKLPLAPQGSDFAKLVWQTLLEIPYGEVATYGEIAQRIARRMHKKSMSPQAVGSAVGRNPISVIIPCHRVVGKGGNLVGYNGGVQKKVFLLAHEGIELSRFFTPFSR